jgi:signal transduction histidine kinase
MGGQDMSAGTGRADANPQSPPAEDLEAALIEAGVLLASELTLPAVLRRLVEIAVRITHARYGAMGVTGPHGELVELITVGLTDQERAAIGPAPRGLGILGALLHDPHPLRLSRLQDDPRSVGFPPHHPPMTSFLGAPVRARGQLVGNLYLTDKEGGRPFDGADEGAVATLATQAAVAIANAQTYRELRQRERWLGALHEITAALLAGEPQQTLMNSIVRSAREVSGADLAAIALAVGGGSSELRVAAADGAGADRILGTPAMASRTTFHSVLGTGRPLIVRPSPGDRFTQSLQGAGIPVGVLMVVPLLIRERASGAIVLIRSAPDANFNSEDLSLLESFASQATLALDYAAVQVQSRRLAVIEERHRIARDLHDEPVQALIYLARRLEAMALEAAATGTAATQLEDTMQLAVAVADGLRQLTEGLRSEILEYEGLPAALGDLAERFSARVGIPAEVSIRDELQRSTPEVERGLLRVAQEALSNVERHAQARRVRLDLAVRAGQLSLRVADDGVGFLVSGEGAVRPGLGTIGMRERMELMGGRLLIWSRPRRGTLVVARLPNDVYQRAGGNHAGGNR